MMPAFGPASAQRKTAVPFNTAQRSEKMVEIAGLEPATF